MSLIFIGVDGAEGEILGGRLALGEDIEEGGFANVGDAHDAHLEVGADPPDERLLLRLIHFLRRHRELAATQSKSRSRIMLDHTVSGMATHESQSCFKITKWSPASVNSLSPYGMRPLKLCGSFSGWNVILENC